MSSEDIEDAEPMVSLCVDCARHPSLKRVIEADSVTGLCAFCERLDATVRNPDRTEPMVMLLRSLIRFYWDEFSYNGHWGGDSVLDLFVAHDNPVVTPAVSNTYHDEFDDLLQQPPYPNVDEGVAIYAGFDADGDRMLNLAISRTDPGPFLELQRRLLTENFFEVEAALQALIDPFLDDIAIALPVDDLWYRARLGQKAVFQRYDGGWERTIVRQPWLGSEIAAPSPIKAGVGRLNRGGVSMLYLASDTYTAIAEIRPHPGHYVSVGGFKSLERIRLADFNPDIGLFSANDERLELYATIQAFDRLMSLPVTPEEKTPYLLTQLLAEVLLRRGFDGVRFRSSVSDGSNICVFYPAKFGFADGYSEIRRLKSVAYDAPSVASLVVPGPDDYPLEGQR